MNSFSYDFFIGGLVRPLCTCFLYSPPYWTYHTVCTIQYRTVGFIGLLLLLFYLFNPIESYDIYIYIYIFEDGIEVYF